jgi:hypothetical protein
VHTVLYEKKVIKALGVLRSRPKFGSAGADVAIVVARAKQALVTRDPTANELLVSDFGLETTAGGGLSPLAGMFKVGHIKQRLDRLKAVLEACDRDGKGRSAYLKRTTYSWEVRHDLSTEGFLTCYFSARSPERHPLRRSM